MFASGVAPSERPHTISFRPATDLVPLDSAFGRRSIKLSVDHLYAIEAMSDSPLTPWVIRTVAYFYQVYDNDEWELFSYHWDPREESPSWAEFPHMHVGRRLPRLAIGDGNASLVLGDLHFPTEPVAVAALVRLLIRELGVPPRRPDWERILDKSAAAFRRSLAVGDAP